MRTYTSYINDIPRYINNSNSDNITWMMEQVNDALRYLTKKFYFNERSYTVPGGTVGLQEYYNLPPQVKEIINVTVNIGGIIWTPKECSTRSEWDALHVMPFWQDFPAYFFVWDQRVGIFPTPATSGWDVQINYKSHIPDLVMPDVTSGATLAVTNGNSTVTASSNIFNAWMAIGNTFAWLRIPHSSTDTQNGDNQWYQINSVESPTSLTLKNQYTGNTLSAASTFTIGQAPILPEDYQDLPMYRALELYYTTRFPDAVRAQLYHQKYEDGLAELNDEYGSKTTSVVLSDTEANIANANLFVRSVSEV